MGGVEGWVGRCGTRCGRVRLREVVEVVEVVEVAEQKSGDAQLVCGKMASIKADRLETRWLFCRG